MNRKALVVVLWKADPAAAEKKVLVLQLTPERGGFWQSVTGSVEEGESFEEGALREAEEETGFRFGRLPQYLGLEYEFDGRWGRARERAYLLTLVGGERPSPPRLDPKEHVAFRWVDPAEAASLVKYENNRLAVERAARPLAPLFLSRAGRFFQEGEEVTHARTVELLHRSLVKAGESYLVRMGAEELDVIVEDLPRFVVSYDRSEGKMTLLGGREETLRPETILIRPDHSLSAELESGWRAVFLSPAYYEIAKDLKEGSREGEYVLHFRGRDHLLSVPH